MFVNVWSLLSSCLAWKAQGHGNGDHGSARSAFVHIARVDEKADKGSFFDNSCAGFVTFLSLKTEKYEEFRA